MQKLSMTPKERFEATLKGQPLSGRVPHFELVFFLTMECFGKVHPSHRSYGQWDQMEEIDQYILYRFRTVSDRILKAYDEYEFHTFYHTFYNFCIVDFLLSCTRTVLGLCCPAVGRFWLIVVFLQDEIMRRPQEICFTLS